MYLPTCFIDNGAVNHILTYCIHQRFHLRWAIKPFDLDQYPALTRRVRRFHVNPNMAIRKNKQHLFTIDLPSIFDQRPLTVSWWRPLAGKSISSCLDRSGHCGAAELTPRKTKMYLTKFYHF